MLHADPPRPVSIVEAARLLTAKQTPEVRSFKMTMDGVLTVTGYSPDEVKDLLAAYRDHIIVFSKAMQELQASEEGNPLYTPGGYQ